MIKTATHNGYTCIFDEDKHIYTVNGQRLISGTTFIKQFFPKFDGPAIAEKIAPDRGTTPAELLKEWKEKSERASQDGHMVHGYAEWMFDPNSGPGLPPYAIEADRVGFLTVQLLKACDKLQERNFEPIEAEKIIFSPGLGVAGMIDLLMTDKDGQVILIDWKTSEELKLDNPFQTCFLPISHLEDSNLIHYSLQLGLYQYILEVEEYFPNATGFQRLIIHLTENSNTPYKCKYLKDEIESILI